MRFESVTTHAFGAFRNETLELAPGMTIVYGPNEAGKSTWHAALYAALCGMRRTRGAMRREDRDFAGCHRPWDGAEWDVSARIELADGRRIEIRQDLDGRIDCRAVDLGTARDVSADIIHEGSPDGSRWLGLDRGAFRATACIGQAQILSVLEDPSALQEHLQRAAATAGRDETAAAAIDAIARFQRDHVGLDRVNARGPLRRARENLERLRGELEETRRLHEEYLGLIDAAEKRIAERNRLETRRRAVERVLARDRAKELSAQLGRFRSLAEKLAAGSPPAADGIANRAAATVDELRDLARTLEEPVPNVDPTLRQRVEAARREVERTRPEDRRRPALAVVLGSVAVGAAVAALGQAEAGLAVGVTGLVVAVVLLLVRDAGAHERALAALRETESRRVVREEMRTAAIARREKARQRIGSLGLEPEPSRVRAVVRELEIALRGQEPATAIAAMERELSGLQAVAGSGPASGLEDVPDGAAAAELLDSLRQQIREIDREKDRLEGAVQERTRRLPSVADAEEAVAEAERELERVRRLERTLERTRELLERAEERVHRDVAEELADAVRPWLPRITAGRYRDLAVNAGDLSVRVKDPDGHWREAIRLSHGTTEQIYLLLRVALAKHLIRKGESCPLLFDEVTVQSDRHRTGAILELLHALSRECQIVLFTQEEDLREWGRAHLAGDRDRLVELAAPR